MPIPAAASVAAAVQPLLALALPYFRPQPIELFGPLKIQPWGLIVATGFILGTMLAQKIARQRGMDPRVYSDLVVWMAVGALVFGHLGHALAYDPKHYLQKPWELFFVWEGLSSFGGFFGCTVLAVIFFRRRKLDLFRFADIQMVGLVLGWAVGRIGCFSVHDHIGRRVEEAAPWVQSAIGWLAISFPAGVPGGGKTGAIRFDLGLMDSLLSWIILAVLLLMARRPRHAGVLMATGPLIYMPVRFGLDFLRNADLQVHDARYGGFTPAQFGCVIMFALALGILVRSRKREIWPEPGTQPWVEPAEAGAEAAGAGSAAGGGATGSPSRRPRRRR